MKTTQRDASGKVTRYGFRALGGRFDDPRHPLSGRRAAHRRWRAGPFPRGAGQGSLPPYGPAGGEGCRHALHQGAVERFPADFGNGRMAMFIGSSTAREFVTPAFAAASSRGVHRYPPGQPRSRSPCSMAPTWPSSRRRPRGSAPRGLRPLARAEPNPDRLLGNFALHLRRCVAGRGPS